MTEEDKEQYKAATKCWICEGEEFSDVIVKSRLQKNVNIEEVETERNRLTVLIQELNNCHKRKKELGESPSVERERNRLTGLIEELNNYHERKKEIGTGTALTKERKRLKDLGLDLTRVDNAIETVNGYNKRIKDIGTMASLTKRLKNLNVNSLIDELKVCNDRIAKMESLTSLQKKVDRLNAKIKENIDLDLKISEAKARGDKGHKVRDHCHLTGKYRGAAHSECNFKLQIKPGTTCIPVIFHNLKGYDAHLIIREIAKVFDKVSCIPLNFEKFISFSAGQLRFIDSCQFMGKSLDALVKINDDFSITDRTFNDMSDWVKQKGVYPYEYMSSFDRFNETKLPFKDKFYSSLCGKHITDKEYERAQEIWKAFNCKTLGDYHDLYLKSDVVLLADVFENFRATSRKHYGLDPCHYYTAPGLSWDAMLKKTGITLELLTDYDMHCFVEKGIRGGISMVSHRYAKANNPYLEEHDSSKPNNYIMYLDANSLYPTAMVKDLPYKDFEWVNDVSSLDPIHPPSGKGYILEGDLDYPEDLHDLHNDYPLAPVRRKVDVEELSEYQNALFGERGSKNTGPEKLLLDLHDKKEYVIHYKTLELYLSLGLKLTKIHRAISFSQKPWMAPYIELNTTLRQKAVNEFEKDFFKLMSNSVFGKTMENVWNRVDIKFVKITDNPEKIRKINTKPTFKRSKIIVEDELVLVQVNRTKVKLFKPIYAGMTILDVSKWHMYDWYYNVLKFQYKGNVQLLYTDTDSLIVDIRTDNAYQDMVNHEEHYDFCDMNKNMPLPADKNKNKKVLGKFKDECKGIPVLEFIGLRSKMYSIKKDDSNVMKRAKGVKRCVVEDDITHENYKEALFYNIKCEREMNVLQSMRHIIYGLTKTKTALSPLDTKRYILEDKISTLAFGHKLNNSRRNLF